MKESISVQENARLAGCAPGEDITRDAVVGLLADAGGLLLDLGAAEGRLARSLPGLKFIELDLSYHLLSQGVNRITVVGQIFTVPLKSESFDWVILLNTLENYRKNDVLALLTEALRVLKTGGKLVFSFRGGASIKLRYLEFRHNLSGGGSLFRFNARRWLKKMGKCYLGNVYNLLPRPKTIIHRLLGTPADARAIVVVQKLSLPDHPV